MKHFISLLFFLLIVFFSIQKTHAASPPAVIFYEIMWAGSSVSTADEWFVLKNNTDSEIILNGWQVTHLVGKDAKEEPMLLLSGKISAGGYFFVSNYKAEDEESAFKIAPDMSSPDHNTVSLKNDHLQLKLYDSAFTTGTGMVPIDTAGDSEVNKPFGGSNGDKNKNIPKASMVRVNDGIDGSLKDAWGTTKVQCNIDYDKTELATPQSSTSKKCHPPNIQLLNNWPEALKIGEIFIAQLLIIDTDAVTVTANGETINDKTYVARCETVGTKEIKITATDADGSRSSTAQEYSCYDGGAVVINEVMPAPKTMDYDQSGTIDTKDEWIELYNTEARPINLAGWWLGDKTKPQKYQLGTDAIIGPNGFLTITHRQSGIALNDDSEEVYLYDPSGLLVDKVVYGKSHDDAGWARFDTGFEWTLAPTYNSQNIKSPIGQSAVASNGAPSDPVAEPVAEPMEVVTYKITTTKTTTPPSYASLPMQYLSEVPVVKIFGQTDSMPRSVNQYVISQMIMGLAGLLSLARVSYNVLCLLL